LLQKTSAIQVLNMAISTAIQHYGISYRHYSKRCIISTNLEDSNSAICIWLDQSCVKKVEVLFYFQAMSPLQPDKTNLASV